MFKYSLVLLAALAVVIAGCTPTGTNTNSNSNSNSNANTNTAMEDDDDAMMDDKNDAMMLDEGESASGGEDDDAMMDDKDDAMTDGKDLGDITFSSYTNPAVGYTLDIPDNWYWRHYYRTEIGDASPNVEDYLFMSPTHDITGFQTESPAEVVIEISDRDLADFADSTMTSTEVSVGGQAATRLAGIVNNNVFENYQKIEYQFTYNSKTYRVIYLAPDGLDNNEAIFEAVVKSLKFGE